MSTKLNVFSKLALVLGLAIAGSQAAQADTMCSVLSFNQAAGVAASLNVILISGQQIQLMDDVSGDVYQITQADTVSALGGYTVSVVTTRGQRRTLDIGHIRAINQTAGQSVSLANIAGCNP